MNKLIIKGSVANNYEVIKNFVKQNEITMTPEELYLKSNLSHNMIEAFFCVYNSLKKEYLQKFFTLNPYEPTTSKPNS
jgi:hypothetical protein